MRTVIKGG